MSKVILISQVPLPYSHIGSWTTLYKNYFASNHKIDFLICKQPEYYFDNVKYGIVKSTFKLKIEKRVSKNKYVIYLNELKKILVENSEEKFIIQVIDNHGLVEPLNNFLIKFNLRKRCYLQFFYHGFTPFHENFHGRFFYEAVDEMIVLTNDSYLAHKNYYTILPCRFSVLHNGIDTNKFFKISESEKQKLKSELGFKAKKIFVWCSQDRPKKGLNLILDAWKRIYLQHSDCELLVIGAEKKATSEGVHYLGKIPNDDLPKYFQISDVYLFPVLWHEGFGLSLIEALHCGNYCIASAIGGVPEVLQYGKLGKLIENPHFIQSWSDAIEDYLSNNTTLFEVPKNLYSTQSWCQGMNVIIENAKFNLS
ncbi:MAG: glycosyltransferase family 4 protein [Flavobacterium sp.]|nr:glycosyltransferase family 4 protein [Flavobacterium sp.]